jgi:phage terminase large subunit
MSVLAISRASYNLQQLVNPTERQLEFLRATAEKRFVLYGGQAGGGKSYILRWWLVLYLIDCFQSLGLRGVRAGLFCEDYPTLNDRQISKMRAEFPGWLGTMSRVDGALNFTLRPEYGAGVIALRNLDDPGKYYSAEFAAIAVDELTRNPLSVFNDLKFRMRWPGIPRPKFGAGTNPGGIGHAWVKKYWVTREYPPELEVARDEFVLVKAEAADNPHLSPEYHQSLLELPPDMARKVAHGDWDVPTGQYFPRFDPKIHVIPHEEALRRIQRWHTRSLSGDWGFQHPHAFHWHSMDERKTVITYRELWDRGIGESEVGRRITAEEARDHYLKPLDGFVFSWDAGKLSPRSSIDQPKSTSQMISEALGPRIPKPHPCDSSPGVRLIRARLMSQVIEANSWLISDACPKLIAAIPEMMRDEDKQEEMRKIDHDESQIGDDPVDSAGTGLQWMLRVPIKPRDVKREEEFQRVRMTFAEKNSEIQERAADFAKFGGKKYD